jgi:hypothetical protein
VQLRSLVLSAKVHRVTDSRAFKDDRPIVADNPSPKLGNRLALARFRNFHVPGNDVPRTDRCLEVPVNIQKNGTRGRATPPPQRRSRWRW